MFTHEVKVITNSDTINFLLQKPIMSERKAKWMLMLSELDIMVERPKAIKSQVFAELIKYAHLSQRKSYQYKTTKNVGFYTLTVLLLAINEVP